MWFGEREALTLMINAGGQLPSLCISRDMHSIDSWWKRSEGFHVGKDKIIRVCVRVPWVCFSWMHGRQGLCIDRKIPSNHLKRLGVWDSQERVSASI